MPNYDFQALVKKVMTDDAFAANLSSNPTQALRGAGIEPTAELLDAIKGVDAASIKKLATAFKEDQAAAA